MRLLPQRSRILLAVLASFAVGCASSPIARRIPAASSTGTKYPISVYGGDESTFTPALNTGSIIEDRDHYDVVVVGGGLAGLSAALWLSDHQKKVLLLEKEEHLGGLASGTFSSEGIRYDRGAAYWTSAYPEELEILKRIKLGDYEAKHPIPEPIDSYLMVSKKPDGTVQSSLYEGIWDEALKRLPASFELFKHALKKANDDQLIPNQPFEEFDGKNDLDSMSAAQWIRSMPATVARDMSPEGRKVYSHYRQHLNSGRLNPSDPMRGVLELMDLYCRSALGANTDKVSAMAFANFYISEIETRYTTQSGTGKAAENMVRILGDRDHRDFVRLQTRSGVAKVAQRGEHVEVTYIQNRENHKVMSDYVVFAAQLKIATKIIEGFNTESRDPQVREQTRLIGSLNYAHYSVHAVEVTGHPYRTSYDTWTRASDYRETDFTDVIIGRWMEPLIKGYEGYRDDFSRQPDAKDSILSIYHPLPPSIVKEGNGYGNAEAIDFAEKAVDRLLELYGPLLKEKWNSKLEIKSVHTNRWPYSVHVAAPGHFTQKARILRKPFGRIFFANNNLGTPAFEEALFRGHCAALNVLNRYRADFGRESWSKCPIDR